MAVASAAGMSTVARREDRPRQPRLPPSRPGVPTIRSRRRHRGRRWLRRTIRRCGRSQCRTPRVPVHVGRSCQQRQPQRIRGAGHTSPRGRTQRRPALAAAPPRPHLATPRSIRPCTNSRSRTVSKSRRRGFRWSRKFPFLGPCQRLDRRGARTHDQWGIWRILGAVRRVPGLRPPAG